MGDAKFTVGSGGLTPEDARPARKWVPQVSLFETWESNVPFPFQFHSGPRRPVYQISKALTKGR